MNSQAAERHCNQEVSKTFGAVGQMFVSKFRRIINESVNKSILSIDLVWPAVRSSPSDPHQVNRTKNRGHATGFDDP